MATDLRLVLTYHSNSRNPRARKWYGVRLCVSTALGLVPAGYARLVLPQPVNRAACSRELEAFGARHGVPVERGLYREGHVQQNEVLSAAVMVREG